MLPHRGLVSYRLSLPGRRIPLQRAVRDQLSSLGRRWSGGLPFRSVQVPEMLHQAAPCEGVCETCRFDTKWGGGQMGLRIRTIPLGGIVVPE
jgi:hypothetical protein